MRSKLNVNQTSEYHEHNLYVPTRTIYFGGEMLLECSDEVNSTTVSSLIKNLHILETKEIAPITLILNTIGGSWEDGIAVYDMIRTLKSEVTIIGFGKLYSMGSIIFQAGIKRILLPHTAMLIHDGSDGFVGNAKDYEKWGEHSKLVREQMYKIYYEQMKKKKSRITLTKIEEMCSHDTILTAEEAVNLGLADEIIQYLR